MFHRHGTSQGMCKYCNKQFHVTPDHKVFCDIDCMLNHRKGFIYGRATRKYKPGEDYRVKHPEAFTESDVYLTTNNQKALARLKRERQ